MLGLGSVDEKGVFAEDSDGDYGFQDVDKVDDRLMQSAAWQAWESFQDFLSEDLCQIRQSL